MEHAGESFSQNARGCYRGTRPGRQGVYLHVVRWEEENGPVPTGHMLVCLDRDPSNHAPSNHTCLNRSDAMRLALRLRREEKQRTTP